MIELLCVIVGAGVALFAYHMGRNNAAPLPKFSVPFFHRAEGEAPASTTASPPRPPRSM